MQSNSSGIVFLTGGNGFIGSRVLRVLLNEGYAVRCLLRASSDTRRIDDLDFERIEGDIRDGALLKEAIRGCRGVIHLASISAWKDIESPDIHSVVVEGTENVLAAATGNSQVRTVHVSSSVAINGTEKPRILDETSDYNLPVGRYLYADGKRRAEELCASYVNRGLPVVIVNPVEVYGPEDWNLVTAETLLRFSGNRPVLVCNGGTCITHVDDVAAGILAAFKKGRVGERYILGGGNLTLKELAQLTLEILEMGNGVYSVPNLVVRILGRIQDVFGMSLGIDSAVIPYAARYWFMDNSKAIKELKVNFRSPREVLELTLKWLVEKEFIKPGNLN